MATSGSDILSYRGNSGLGNNSDIPAIATKDLEVVNNTLDRLQAQNSMRNQQIFQQRVKDRDALLGELDSGSIKVNDLLDQDMPTVKEGLQKLDEAYYKRIKKGINDIDAAREYKQALRDAQDRVTQAQARKISYDTLNGDIAKETLPRKQEAMKAHLDKTINGGFWKDLTPYQQTLDADIAKNILGTAEFTTEQFTDAKNPLIKGKRTLFDYEKTRQKNYDNFLEDGNARHDQQWIMSELQKMQPQDFLDEMQSINNRIKEHNDLKGVTAGQPGFVKEVPFAVNKQTGQNIISEKVPDFAAKYTLAHQKPFNSAETELDKTALALMQEQEKQRHNKATERNAAANAAANLMRARSYTALQNKRLSQMNDDEKKVKNFWDGITGKIKKYNVNSGSGPVEGDYVFAGDLPAGFQFIGGLDADGKPIRLEPKKGAGGSEYYETKYYNSNGGSLDLLSQYNEYKSAGGKGSYDDLRNRLLKEGKINVELVGENGTGNFETAFQTARAISNKGTTKGEEPIFSEANDEQ